MGIVSKTKNLKLLLWSSFLPPYIFFKHITEQKCFYRNSFCIFRSKIIKMIVHPKINIFVIIYSLSFQTCMTFFIMRNRTLGCKQDWMPFNFIVWIKKYQILCVSQKKVSHIFFEVNYRFNVDLFKVCIYCKKNESVKYTILSYSVMIIRVCIVMQLV